MKSSALSIFWRFSGFVVWTCIGYLVFELFLRKVPASVLLLNTFVWQLLFCFIDWKGRGFRSPFKSFRYYLIDRYSIVYALAVFGYWSLFWFGICILPSGENASGIAVAFLSLNTISIPIAVNFASRHQGKRELISLIFTGLALAFCISLMELDPPAQKFSLWMEWIEHAVHKWLGTEITPSLLPNLQEASQSDGNAYLYACAIACFVFAVFCEALGDFSHKRRESLKETPLGGRLFDVAVMDRMIGMTNKIIRCDDVGKLSVIACDCEIQNRNKDLSRRQNIESALANPDDPSANTEAGRQRAYEEINHLNARIDTS